MANLKIDVKTTEAKLWRTYRNEKYGNERYILVDTEESVVEVEADTESFQRDSVVKLVLKKEGEEIILISKEYPKGSIIIIKEAVGLLMQIWSENLEVRIYQYM